MTSHILSVWANPDNDFIKTGFLLQHIHKRPDKTLIKDLLLDHQALNIRPQKWSTAMLEVVGEEALFRMDDHVAYSKFSELSGPKTKVALTLGTTWHEIRHVRIWNASARSTWGQDKDRILSARQKFSASPHQYQAPPRTAGMIPADHWCQGDRQRVAGPASAVTLSRPTEKLRPVTSDRFSDGHTAHPVRCLSD